MPSYCLITAFAFAFDASLSKPKNLTATFLCSTEQVAAVTHALCLNVTADRLHSSYYGVPILQPSEAQQNTWDPKERIITYASAVRSLCAAR